MEVAKLSQRTAENASPLNPLTDTLPQLTGRSDVDVESKTDPDDSDYEEDVNPDVEENSGMPSSGEERQTAFSKCGRSDDDEEEAVENLPVDLIPHELALSFDHILEQIFSYLGTSDLLTCRLVSHRFLKFTKVPLGEKIRLVFNNYELSLSSAFPVVKQSGRTLEQLTTLLEQWLSSSSSAELNLISFPCTFFYFDNARLGGDVLERFLNIHGHNIINLSILISYKDSTHEKILINQLSHLLTIQAPRLERLCLTLRDKNYIVDWEQEVPLEIRQSINENFPNRSNFSPLLQTDPELKEITDRAKSLRNKSCLKVLRVYGEGLAKVLEFIFQISPKLQDVMLRERSLVYLLQPVSRVYLLKSLWFGPEIDDPNRCPNCMLAIMEKILKENNLRLKKLFISFDKILPLCKTNFVFENRLVSVINGILEQNRETLEELSISFTLSLLQGIKMPSSMTALRSIEISENEEIRATKETVFPKGFPFSKTFPKLTCVMLVYFPAGEFGYNIFFEFLNCLDFQGDGDHDPTLSLSVNKVLLAADCFLDPATEEVLPIIPEFILQRIRKLFPKARIEVEQMAF